MDTGRGTFVPVEDEEHEKQLRAENPKAGVKLQVGMIIGIGESRFVIKSILAGGEVRMKLMWQRPKMPVMTRAIPESPTATPE